MRRFLPGALLVCSFAPLAYADAPRHVGRPVVEVLLELREPGLDFIYSSELVPETLRVLAEPRSISRLEVAHEILAAHGLALSVVRPGLYAVVAARTPDERAARESASDALAGRPLTGMKLDEVVVSTSRYALDGSGAFGSVHVTGDSIAAQPVLGEDALRALGRLPGIAQTSLSAQSSIRGGEAGEQLTLLDGFPLRQAFHLPGYQSVFGVLDPGLIDDAEIYTGGFPVRYGNRMGGVFDLRTIDALHEPRTALGLSVFNAMARRGGALQAFDADWLAAGRVGTLKPFIQAFAHDAGSPTYADAYARLGHGDADRLRITANFLWSRDELAISREGQGEVAQIESRNRYLWLRADRNWSNGIQGSLWLGHSSVDSFRSGLIDNPGIAGGSVEDDRSSAYRELRSRLAWQPWPRHWFEGGFEWLAEDADYDYVAGAIFSPAVADLFGRATTLSRTIELAPERERIALFAAHRWRIADAVTSEVGLRAQRTITTGTTAENWLYDPRINLLWQAGPVTQLRAHWGRFHQTDEVHELKVEDGLTSFPEAQRSEHWIVGLDHRLRNGVKLRLEGFRKLQAGPRPHFENLLDPLSPIPEIAPDRVMIAPVEAEVRGAEFSVIAEERAVSWWAGVSWSEVRDLVDGRHVPRSWDQTWAASAGVDWLRGPWRLGAVAGAHRGWPTTLVSGNALGERNAARFPSRFTLDLRAEYRKPLAVGKLAWVIELTNAVNIGNTCCSELIAIDDGTGGVSFTTRRSDWLPLVPSVGVLWEF